MIYKEEKRKRIENIRCVSETLAYSEDMTNTQNTCSRQCANCRWSIPLEERYDQVFCINENSENSEGNVEATDCCTHFELAE